MFIDCEIGNGVIKTMNFVLFMGLVYFAQGSTASTFGELPGLDELETRVQAGENAEQTWRTLFDATQYLLSAGKIPAFKEGLRKLGRDGDPLSLARLYSVAIETDVYDSLDRNDAKHILERAKSQLDRSSDSPSDSVIAGTQVYTSKDQNFNDSEWRWIRGNFYYFLHDTNNLKNLLGVRSKEDTLNYAILVDGYVELLFSRLENSNEYAASSVLHLEQAMAALIPKQKGQWSSVGFSEGRIALYLGRAYLTLASDSKEPDRTEFVELASKYARIARNGLELYISPLFFGRAHNLSADVLDEVIRKKDLKSYNSVPVAILSNRRNSMRILAGQYH